MAGGGVVEFDFVIQLDLAGGVGGEDDVIAIGIVDAATIGGGGEVRVCSTNQDGEIELVGVGRGGAGDDVVAVLAVDSLPGA